MGGLFRSIVVSLVPAFYAVKLPLATIDKKSVDCESRRDRSASGSRVQRDGFGHGCGLLGR